MPAADTNLATISSNNQQVRHCPLSKPVDEATRLDRNSNKLRLAVGNQVSGKAEGNAGKNLCVVWLFGYALQQPDRQNLIA